MKVKINKSLLLLTAVFSMQVSALDTSATISAGVDSNPLRLSSQWDIESASFVSLDLNVAHRFDNNIKLFAALHQDDYASKVDDADKSKIRAGIKYGHDGSWLNKKSTHRYQLDYTHYDKTYVSRVSNDTPVYSGVAIKDRYDYESFAFKQANQVKLDKLNRWNLGFMFKDKAYESYEAQGLSNLDYIEYQVDTGWIHFFNKRNKLDVDFAVKKRVYDDRRNLDMLGVTIANSDREYDYLTLSLDYYYRYRKSLKYAVGIGYEDRQDNAEGYYDAEKMTAYASVNYRPAKAHYLNAKLKYTDLDYPNQIDNAMLNLTDEEEAATRKGFQLNLGYDYRWKVGKNSDLLVSLEHTLQDYDSENIYYRYDRNITQAGLKWSF